VTSALAGVSAEPLHQGAAAALMDALQTVDRLQRGRGPLAQSTALDAIAGGPSSYNLAGCGGPSAGIPSRALDMLQRDYFSHEIAGCSGGQMVFATYLGSVPWHAAGENIAWAAGTDSVVDDIVRINTLWLNSPEHLANIVSPAYSRVGCGAAFTATGSYQDASGPLFVWACDFTG
jgi:Cysteine-rich secretory protein family